MSYSSSNRSIAIPDDAPPAIAGPVSAMERSDEAWRGTRTAPLSFAQERAWTLCQLDPSSRLFTLTLPLRLRGPLDVRRLGRAIGDIIARHEILRTTIVTRDGEPRQLIHPAGRSELRVVDLRELSIARAEAVSLALRDAEARRRFDLVRGPLFAPVLVAIRPAHHLLLVRMHHLVIDAWSISVLVRELQWLYRGSADGDVEPLPPLPLQYADFATEQRQSLSGARRERLLQYWRQQLDSLQPLDLATDFARPAVQRFAGASRSSRVDASVRAALERLGRDERATPFIVLLAAFQALLHRYTGQADVAVGVPMAGRTRAPLEPLIGFFVNTLVLRANVEADATFRALLRQVRAAMLGAFAHQDLPFEQLVDALQPARSLSRHPLFQVTFSMPNVPVPSWTAGDLRIERFDAPLRIAKFDLELHAHPAGDALETTLVYNTDLFEEGSADRLLRHYARLLAEIAANPDRPIGSLELIDDAERTLLLQTWNRAEAAPEAALVPALVEAQAAARPDAVALSGAETVTYAALDARANQLARRLRALGVGPDVRVGVCLDRSPALVVALLGVWKAGGAYLPLDPSHPADRLAFMLTDAGVEIAVTDTTHATTLSSSAVTLVRLDADLASLEADADTADLPDPGVRPEHLAYVVYTSGSTGQPKGVLIEHRHLAHTIAASQRRFALRADDVVAAVAPIGFDIFGFELWLPLGAGTRVDLLDRDEVFDLGRLRARVRGATVFHAVPSLMRLLVDDAADRSADASPLRGLRLVFTGGDRVPSDLVAALRRAAPDAACHVLYGPTEATIICTSQAVGAGDPARALIGRPLSNCRIYVIDGRGDLAPVGVPGELCIGGGGVARGYLHRPELDAARFAIVQGERVYRSGDRARWRADGTLEFIGRVDDQVKIRGFRVEPGEIEAALARQPGVRESAVIARADGEDRQLVAYVVAAADVTLSTTSLAAGLRTILPDYMVPAAFVQVAALPRNANGKLDVAALPAPQATMREGVAPRTPTESVLLDLWTECLGVDGLGIHDDFFLAGGHSLLAIRLLARVNTWFRLALPASAMFEAPTIAAMAERIERAGREQAGVSTPPLVPVARGARIPVSLAQQRLWFLQRLEPENRAYNLSLTLQVIGACQVGALRRAIVDLVRRHEVLRTRLSEHDGVPLQSIDTTDPVIPVVDLDGVGERVARETASAIATRVVSEPYDLAGPLMRIAIVRLSTDRHLLAVGLHHLIADGWSMGVFARELSACYTARVAGAIASLPPLPVQYADFAVWQREQLHGDRLARLLTHWRERLARLQPLPLPTDRPRPDVPRFRGGRVVSALHPDLLARLIELGRAEHATLFMMLLAGFAAVLERYTGQTDVAVGTPTAGRTRAEVEGLIGFFVDTLVLRTDLSGTPSFRTAIARVRETVLDAFAHQDLPFERLVEALQPARSLGRNPLFQVGFSFQQGEAAAWSLPGLQVEPVPVDFQTAKFDLELHVEVGGRGSHATLVYDVDLFEASTAQQLLDRYATALALAVADPDRPLAQLPILRADEQAALAQRREAARAAASAASGPIVAYVPVVGGRIDHHDEPRTSTELQLALIWEELLGLDAIGVHDSFFALGGHSLLAARLVARIERRLGRRLPLAILFRHDTIRGLAAIVDGGHALPAPSIVVPIQPHGADRPFFCVHAAGGQALSYLPLARRLGTTRPFYGLQAPYYEDPAAAYGSLREMAGAYVRAVREVQPIGPYHLGGLSFGGVAAYEMACQLRTQGQAVALVALFDTMSPRVTRALDRRDGDDCSRLVAMAREEGRRRNVDVNVDVDTLRAMPPDARLPWLAAAMEVAGIKGDVAALGRSWRAFQTSTRLLREYEPERYDGRLTIFRADAEHGPDRVDAAVAAALRAVRDRDPSLGWNDLCAEPAAVHDIPGEHVTIAVEPNVRALADALRVAFDASTPDPAPCPREASLT